MCGIVGGMGSLSSEVLEQMTKKLANRGPDNSAYLSLGEVHLGHTRLSIIDLSPSSNQPLWDMKKNFCIVFNGEIYNYQLLREQLSDLGYRFFSKGEAEVIVAMYAHYGPECLQQLKGIFAFAIWDVQKREFFIARDRFGVKPLYYTITDDGFYFSSEIKALLVVPGVSKELNHDTLFRTIVCLWNPGDETVLKSINKVSPGHYLLVKEKKLVANIKYGEWPLVNPDTMSKAKAQECIHDALYQSVQDQLVADVPIGSFLSGGVDSSLLVAMAKAAGVQSMECFTIDSSSHDNNQDGFEDDLPYAKKVAKQLNVPLTIIKVDPNILELLPIMLYHLDEPKADPAALNVLLICKAVREKGIKVLFSGAGGDDIFTGYRRHRAVFLERYWIWLPLKFRRFLQRLSAIGPKHIVFFRRLEKLFAYVTLPENERLLSYFYWIDPQVVRDLFTEAIQEKLSSNPFESVLQDLKARNEPNKLEKILYLDKRYFLTDHNLDYTDKMSMAHGVEVRVPFVDEHVVAAASRVKTKHKQNHTQGKRILKKVAERYLEKSIIYRSKVGFSVPLRHWLNYNLKPMVDELLSEPSLLQRGLFNPNKVKALIDQDRAGSQDYSYPIFALVCIELWCRLFLDNQEASDCYNWHR